MITIEQSEKIATIASKRIAKDFKKLGLYSTPPRISPAIVYAVLDAVAVMEMTRDEDPCELCGLLECRDCIYNL
jgi:3-methyladenine DNA glycosylase Tag